MDTSRSVQERKTDKRHKGRQPKVSNREAEGVSIQFLGDHTDVFQSGLKNDFILVRSLQNFND